MRMEHRVVGDTEIVPENFETLLTCWKDPGNRLNWPHVFILPDWLKVWFDNFGNGAAPFIFSIRQKGDLIGIAPLQIRDKTASFMGDADICDYLDFIVTPENGEVFCRLFLDQVIEKGIAALDLRCLRPDSFTLKIMLPVIRQKGYDAVCEPDGVSVEAALPGAWDEYLAGLDAKQRHEVKRKLRRLEESGDVKFTVYDDGADILDRLEIFFTLFRESRTDKTQFMTDQMENFFNAMISKTARLGILKMGVLNVDGVPAAAVLCFDYHDAIYLYNNGYDPAYAGLSVGVLCKVLLLRYAIDEKKKTFDFLKGNEIYKYRLGGRETTLSRLRVNLT
jgi:CelD/BcsL family acetyltransferase involved in cellulose biosynthesis